MDYIQDKIRVITEQLDLLRRPTAVYNFKIVTPPICC